MCFAAGSSLAIGNLITYIVSYHRIILKYNINEDTFQPLFPLVMTFNTIFFVIANKMVDVFNGQSKPVAAIFATFGLTLCYLSILFECSPYMFIFLFSLGFGSIKGTMFSTALRAGWSHLPKRKGLASGIILSGSGIGGGLASMFI